ncbi:hypothetical protein SD71_16330 [Cohnella kolymensis]|uniref:Histidine kinase/HSP90-like ATPase domain-containing protein n=1 Tax=Cohnella kolymensis TaxID=1590652 RepID=A0ABR5A430_9BACL|nr:ATP-binding protein [Cohnella kolymensis]KIL35187.1 hypothetical protein SD71_16330 [Cohnella kolymensis]
MYVIKLEEDELTSVLRQMQGILVHRDPDQSKLAVQLDFQNQIFISPLLLAVVSAFVEKLRLRHDVDVLCVNLSSVNADYISRMNFFDEVGFHYQEHFTRRKESGRFIPITRITESNYMSITSDLTKIIQQQWGGIDGSIVAALDWSIAEIIDNVFNHSETKIDGFVVAQHFPSRNRIDVTVVDGGMGIPKRLKSRAIYKDLSATEALDIAVEKDVTVDPEINKGAGLFYTKRIIQENRGTLRINSDKAQLRVTGKVKRVDDAPKWTGTIVHLRIRTNIIVDPEIIWGNTPESFDAIMNGDRDLW